jgi:hypothetical protein
VPPSNRCRYDEGVSPQYSAKARANELALSNPTAVETSRTVRPGEASSAIARIRRAWSTRTNGHGEKAYKWRGRP